MRLRHIRKTNAAITLDERNQLPFRTAKVRRIMIGCLY
jgi:hypothetical protein